MEGKAHLKGCGRQVGNGRVSGQCGVVGLCSSCWTSLGAVDVVPRSVAEALADKLQHIAGYFFAGWPDTDDQAAIADIARDALAEYRAAYPKETPSYGAHFRSAVEEIRELPPSERAAVENRRKETP